MTNTTNQHGLLMLDKPLGMSSQQCVSAVRRILGIKKAGHTGTLDPLASGLLPLCCGKATRLAEFLLLDDKHYRATVTLGARTDTGDTEGKIIAQLPVPELTQAHIDATAQSLTGEIQQTPPIYSAIKVQGKPMYAWAREHRENPKRPLPQLSPRLIHIYKLQAQLVDNNTIDMHVSCSKGTYIRTLVEDFAYLLQTTGHLSALQRTRCGHWMLEQAVTLDAIQEKGMDAIQQSWIDMADILSDIPSLQLTAEQAEKIAHGMQLPLPLTDLPPSTDLRGTIALLFDSRLVALARIEEERTLKPFKVLCW